jgi:hypothetical protein
VRVRTLATLDEREWDGLDGFMLVAGWLRQCQPNRRRKSSLKAHRHPIRVQFESRLPDSFDEKVRPFAPGLFWS